MLSVPFLQHLARRADSAVGATLVRPRGLMHPPVLAYHHVGPVAPAADPPLTIDKKIFERQIDWLARQGWQGISASYWMDGVMGRAVLPERPVVITFDDGYADIGEHALPILEHYGFGATVFLVTDLLGRCNTWDTASGRTRYALLDETSVCEWAFRGVEFGGHTRSHQRLVGLPHDRLRSEVAGCRDDIEELVGNVPRAFAYPWGEADIAAKRLVMELFDIAFAASEGRNTLRTDRYWLHRSGALQADSRTDLALRLQLGWTPRHRVRQRVRRRLGNYRRRLVHSMIP